METNKNLLYSTGNAALSYMAAWMRGEFGAEWIHVYVWLSCYAVHLNYHNIINRLYSNIGEGNVGCFVWPPSFTLKLCDDFWKYFSETLDVYWRVSVHEWCLSPGGFHFRVVAT